MPLTEDHSDAEYQIKAYSPGRIVINEIVYTNNLIISRNQLIAHWNSADLLALAALKPEIILIGTGDKSIILKPEILSPLYELGFSVECMSTQSACHTYTILSAENRNVVAGLIL